MIKAPVKLSGAGIVKRFGSLAAVDCVSFEIRSNAIHSFIGPNGAGKTTLFNCISGKLRPDRGVIKLDGLDVTGLPQYRRAQLGLARSFQVTNLFANLSVRESLRLAAQAKLPLQWYDLFRRKERLEAAISASDQMLRKLDLWPSRDVKAGELSHGQQRVLEIGIALATGASTLLLDEPMAGVGREDIGTIADLIIEVARERTVILVEHNMEVVLGISTRITVMHRGRILMEGDPSAVRIDPDVRAAYLGTTR